jgi:hypothetical protein
MATTKSGNTYSKLANKVLTTPPPRRTVTMQEQVVDPAAGGLQFMGPAYAKTKTATTTVDAS